MSKEPLCVFGGVDTHKDVHVAAVIDERGRILDTAPFEANAKGYVTLRKWLESFGTLAKVGVEGTGAYGAGLARYLQDSGVEVVEVNRANRQMRRQRGKSDPVDAEAAARAALNGEATIVPNGHDDIVESIRAAHCLLLGTRDEDPSGLADQGPHRHRAVDASRVNARKDRRSGGPLREVPPR
ncbi:MAG: transposase [Actinomycetota bacterium]|nr:transposase [Actinomycetota bacterium]